MTVIRIFFHWDHCCFILTQVVEPFLPRPTLFHKDIIFVDTVALSSTCSRKMALRMLSSSSYMRKRFDKLDQMENKDGAGDHGSVQTVGKETYESRITEGVLNAKQGNHKMQVKTNENTIIYLQLNKTTS